MMATVLGGVVLALAAATLTLVSLVRQMTVHHLGPGIAIVLAYAGVGVVIARRQPRNPTGWLLIIFVLLYVLGAAATNYAVLAYRLGYHGLPLAAGPSCWPPCRRPRSPCSPWSSCCSRTAS